MKYNKTLHPSDYDNLQPHVALFEDVTSKIDAIIHHKHRRWEYGVALASLDLIRNQNPQTILDVGGGGSPLPAMVASMGYNTIVIDPSKDVLRQDDLAKKLGVHILIDNRDFIDAKLTTVFDVVFCISTLEHVQDDVAFFKKALSVAQCLAVFTVDYHVTGQPQSKDHLRTYNRASLETMAALAAPEWELVDSPDWADHGAHVFGYNFASLVLRRKTVEDGGYLAIPEQIPVEVLDEAAKERQEWLDSYTVGSPDDKEEAFKIGVVLDPIEPKRPAITKPIAANDDMSGEPIHTEPDQPTEPMDVSEAPPKPPKRKRKSKKATTDNA